MSINQHTLINFTKSILSYYAKLSFAEMLASSLIASEDKIEITDTIINVKSIIPKHVNGKVPLIIPLEYK
jgi:uncharacterized membrane protein